MDALPLSADCAFHYRRPRRPGLHPVVYSWGICSYAYGGIRMFPTREPLERGQPLPGAPWGLVRWSAREVLKDGPAEVALGDDGKRRGGSVPRWTG